MHSTRARAGRALLAVAWRKGWHRFANALPLAFCAAATFCVAPAAFGIPSSACEQNGGTEYCEPKQFLWGVPAYSIPYQWISFEEAAGAVLPRMIDQYNIHPQDDYYSKWDPRVPGVPPGTSCLECEAYTHKISDTQGQTAVESQYSSGWTWKAVGWNVYRTIICPPGMTATTGSGTSYCSRSGPTEEKEVGAPPEQPGACKVLVENPIHARAGNKYQREVDYAGQGPMPLAFVRYYNSAGRATRYVGARWSHTYDRRIVELGTNSIPAVSAVRAEGHAIKFSDWGGAWKASKDIKDQLTKLLDGGGAHIGWQLHVAATDETETYDASGRLLSIASRAGLLTALTYSDASTPPSVAPRAGLLIQVTDPMGRALTFTYDRERIIALSDPAGGVYTYGYDEKGNLTTVTYPDGTPGVPGDNPLRTYHYEAAGCEYALTGITDENGEPYATYGYDAQCRATSTQHAGGVDSATLMFNADGTTTVTDALGTVRQYDFQTVHGRSRVSSIDQPCTDCGGAAVAGHTFDANGNTDSEIDFNGNLACRVWDLDRNLETQRVEGLTGSACPGTPVSGVTRTISTEWHASFRVPLRTAEPKRITTFQYDSSGNLTSRSIQATTDTNGSLGFAATPTGSPRTWTYTHTYHATIPGVITQTVADGPRTDLTDTTAYVYDSATGSLASITNALGHVTTFSNYDAHGRPQQITDPNGLVTTLSYDARGRLTSRIVGGEATSYEYDGVGQLSRVTMPDGSYLAYTYDAAHRLVRVEDNLGNHIVYTLDAMGNRIKEEVLDQTATLVQKREREFNALDRLIKDIGGANPATEITQYGYDNQGNLLSVLDPLNRLTQHGYDGLNRLTSVTDPNNGVVTAGYDLLDQVITVTDPRGLLTGYNRNGLGNLLSEGSPDRGTTAYLAYDAAGNPTSIRDQMYRNPLYTYDALNRVTFTNYQNGTQPNTSVEYDGGGSGAPNAKGRLTKITDESGNTTWSYDAHGRVTGKSQLTTYNSLNYTHVLSYTYDGAGRLSTITYPSGRVIGYIYDAAGRVSAITVGSTIILSNVSYHPFGAVKGVTWGSGAVYARTFDASGRIQSYTIGSSTRTLTYDAAGQITAIQDAAVPGLNATYGYDNLGRLVTYTGFPANQSYTYEANGNRTSVTVGANTYPYTIASTSNRLSSTSGPPPAKTHSYDSTGNLVSWSSGTAFTYSARNRLKTVTAPSLSMNLRYNGLGQRVIKATSAGVRRFVYDEAGHLLGEYSGPAALQEYVYLGGMPVATFVGSGPVHYVWPDHLDTPRLVTSTAGQERWRWDSAPFGDTLANENPAGLGTFTFGLRFPGQYADKETGIFYNYFRDYDPQIGRYVQSDPIGLDGGINTYAYVSGNPLQLVDPLGLVATGPRTAPTSGSPSSSCLKGDKCEEQKHDDEQVCRRLPNDTKEDKAVRSRCWASAIERYAACKVGRPIPPLVTWKTVVPVPTIPTEPTDPLSESSPPLQPKNPSPVWIVPVIFILYLLLN